jgi:ribose/xylose/arabinose/galactoside ABC-type transport system permease subunit
VLWRAHLAVQAIIATRETNTWWKCLLSPFQRAVGVFGGQIRAAIVWWFILRIFTVIMNQTRYGNPSAVGGNPAARAQGVNVNRVKVLNHFRYAGRRRWDYGSGAPEVVEAARQGYELT